MHGEYFCPQCGFDESPEEIKRKIEEKIQRKREKADEYIRSHPEKSVMIAAGAGIAVGMILAAMIAKKKMKYRMYQ